ncbi:MAG: response regulator transcription factor [Cyclobacteriaceae bacterium]|nr:response regulator transcription factor [Cyclobacteriaceae bacterium]
MNSKKLLIVEDDQNLGQILSEYLSLKGYESFLFRDGEEGLAAFKAQSYDCCLLDVMMPKMDGYTLAKEIRKVDTQVPFLFLTAKSMKEDRLNGFKLGAEDYITKPFSMEELLLRLNVIFRRGNRVEAEKLDVFTLGKLAFNTKTQELSINGSTTKLTSKESALLNLLCENIDSTLDRRTALKIIWGDDSYFNARSMDVYITKLRKHLKPETSIKIITIHGQGFRLVQGL